MRVRVVEDGGSFFLFRRGKGAVVALLLRRKGMPAWAA